MDGALTAVEYSSYWSCIYRDVLLDMIGNASHLFAQISEIKSRTEKGVFFYTFDVEDFIEMIHDPYSASGARWEPLSKIKNPGLVRLAKGLVKRIKNPATDFAVMIIFANEDPETDKIICNVCSRFMTTDPKKREILSQNSRGYQAGMSDMRISNKDAMNSIFHLTTCRCSGASPEEPNREYTWGRNFLKRIKQKQPPNSNKNTNTNTNTNTNIQNESTGSVSSSASGMNPQKTKMQLNLVKTKN